jgi:hypothetical protein
LHYYKKNNANKIKHQMIKNVPTHLLCFSKFAYREISVPREQFWSKSKPESASKSVGSPENRIGPEQRGSSTGADSTRCTSWDALLGKYKRSKAFWNCECSQNALNISGGSIVVVGGEIRGCFARLEINRLEFWRQAVTQILNNSTFF